MYFEREFILELKNSINIAEVIRNEGFKLSRSGHDFLTLCPFHQEKNPSLRISPSRQFWHCFGCGSTGDCFDFIEQVRKINFPLSIKYLATRYGIKLPCDYNRKRRF